MFMVTPMNIKLRKVQSQNLGEFLQSADKWKKGSKEDGRELGRNQNSTVLGQEVKFEEKKWSGL